MQPAIGTNPFGLNILSKLIMSGNSTALSTLKITPKHNICLQSMYGILHISPLNAIKKMCANLVMMIFSPLLFGILAHCSSICSFQSINSKTLIFSSCTKAKSFLFKTSKSKKPTFSRKKSITFSHRCFTTTQRQG